MYCTYTVIHSLWPGSLIIQYALTINTWRGSILAYDEYMGHLLNININILQKYFTKLNLQKSVSKFYFLSIPFLSFSYRNIKYICIVYSACGLIQFKSIYRHSSSYYRYSLKSHIPVLLISIRETFECSYTLHAHRYIKYQTFYQV